ncbi:hypothetical protein D3Z50_10210 [Clostridiaceae bacterium]|nr:hypothetical protein [Clostridiaceae bacterium]
MTDRQLYGMFQTRSGVPSVPDDMEKPPLQMAWLFAQSICFDKTDLLKINKTGYIIQDRCML